MWTELRMLQEACRYYNFDELIKIASENGAKILGNELYNNRLVDYSYNLASFSRQVV